jgi:hypothetical protein
MPQRPGHHRSHDGTAEPMAKSLCGKAGGLHPPRVPGSRDRAGREASAANPEKLFRLLSWFEDSPLFSQGRSDHSSCAGAGGGRDRGDPAGRWPPPSLRTARCVTDGSLAVPFSQLENCNLPCAKQTLVGAKARPARRHHGEKTGAQIDGPRLRYLGGVRAKWINIAFWRWTGLSCG